MFATIWAEVDRQVQKALKCERADWRLKHVCPACTNKLQHSFNLIFKMLIAMDGNNSLKCLLWHTLSDDPTITGPSNEHKDTCSILGNYYISCDDVNVYAREIVKEAKKLEIGVSLLQLFTFFMILTLSPGSRLQSLHWAMEEYDQWDHQQNVGHLWWDRNLCGILPPQICPCHNWHGAQWGTVSGFLATYLTRLMYLCIEPSILLPVSRSYSMSSALILVLAMTLGVSSRLTSIIAPLDLLPTNSIIHLLQIFSIAMPTITYVSWPAYQYIPKA